MKGKLQAPGEELEGGETHMQGALRELP